MDLNVKLPSTYTMAIIATNEVEVSWLGEVDGVRARVVEGLCRISIAVNIVLVAHLHHIMLLLVIRENYMFTLNVIINE